MLIKSLKCVFLEDEDPLNSIDNHNSGSWWPGDMRSQAHGHNHWKGSVGGFIPPLHRRWNGVYWIHSDVCPSVRPSVRPSATVRPSKYFFQMFLLFLLFSVNGVRSSPAYSAVPVYIITLSLLSEIYMRHPILHSQRRDTHRFWLIFHPKYCTGATSYHIGPCHNGTWLYLFVFLVYILPSCGIFFTFPKLLHKLLRYPKYHATLVGKMMPKFFWNKVFLKNSHLCSTRLQNRNLSFDISGCVR